MIILLFGLGVVLLNEIISPNQSSCIKANHCEYMIIFSPSPQNIDTLPTLKSNNSSYFLGSFTIYIYWAHIIIAPRIPFYMSPFFLLEVVSEILIV